MPFQSKAQRSYLFIHHPKVAEEFAEKTSHKEEEKLPEHKKSLKKRLKAIHHIDKK